MMVASEILDSQTGDIFLIVGLGNPGRRYRRNRHNIGFMVIDRLAEKWQINLQKLKFKAIVGNARISGSQVVLAKPQTNMNLSGESVGPLVDYFRVPNANLLVIYDEIDLPFGTIRLREKGGSGGHNGMKSIINRIGPDFPRLRLGVGRPSGKIDPAAYVLQNFSKDELPVVDDMIQVAIEAVNTFLTENIDVAMTRYNGTVENV